IGLKRRSPRFGQLLQCPERIGNTQKNGFIAKGFRNFFHRKSPNTAVVKPVNVLMAVVFGRSQGEKDSFCRKGQLSTVDQHMCKTAVYCADKLCIQCSRQFVYVPTFIHLCAYPDREGG